MNYPKYTIDEFTLREVLINKDETMSWCKQNEDNREVVSFLRMLGELETAKKFGHKFLLSTENNIQKTKALLRLASVYHWSNEFEIAKELFDECININNDIVTEAFIYQHLAKMYFDKKNYEHSHICALRAHKIRSNFDQDRLASTELILKRLSDFL
ncbi:hypothetical protein [Macrococcoides canis]|uniref:hypothetical protein n=1 Tax=Macrococcoides canis TaxID=1855823 RepID=UPI001B8D3916|nr:hypothetical protein [Macrococcus canis]QUR94565.1 hypothetical protein GOY09_06105 [Macrococcus canis]UTH06921.1 hypothetical protein KFV07_00410 [Macrococcus canis]